MTAPRMAIALSLVLASSAATLAEPAARPVDPNHPMTVEDLVARYLADANSDYERFGPAVTIPDPNGRAFLDANAVGAMVAPRRAPRPLDATADANAPQVSTSGEGDSMREMILRLKRLSGDIEGRVRQRDDVPATAGTPDPSATPQAAGPDANAPAADSASSPLSPEDREIENPYADDDAPAPERPKTIDVPSDSAPRRPPGKRFRTLPTESVRNPLHLADALYRGSYYEAAAAFYELAAKDPNTSGEDVEWAMFQLGNALRYVDPERSRTVFKQLTTEYPESPWTTCAEIQHRTVNWEVRSRPRKLLEEFGEGKDSPGTGAEAAVGSTDAAGPSVATTGSR